MSDKTTEAMTLALEALEIGWSTTHTGKDARELGMKAITILRAALAQEQEQAEPVAHLWRHSETGRTRVVMPDQIITADAAWVVVGPLCLATFQRILQVAEEPAHA